MNDTVQIFAVINDATVNHFVSLEAISVNHHRILPITVPLSCKTYLFNGVLSVYEFFESFLQNR